MPGLNVLLHVRSVEPSFDQSQSTDHALVCCELVMVASFENMSPNRLWGNNLPFFRQPLILTMPN